LDRRETTGHKTCIQALKKYVCPIYKVFFFQVLPDEKLQLSIEGMLLSHFPVDMKVYDEVIARHLSEN